MKKKTPSFKSEDAEREFWSKTDATEYVDWEAAKRIVLPKLKPSQKTISLRLPAMTLAQLKQLSNKRDIPYPFRVCFRWSAAGAEDVENYH